MRAVAADAPDLPWISTKGQVAAVKQWFDVILHARLVDDTICVLARILSRVLAHQEL